MIWRAFRKIPPPVQTSVKQENRSENSNSSLNSNDVSSLNKNTQTAQNDVPRENRAEVTQLQGKQQTSFDQNSAAKSQKNSLADLDQQKTSAQLGDHAEVNSQIQNSQKLDLTKNRQLAKKVLVTNLIATPPMTNGGFDEATWGKLDVTKWQGSAKDGVYELTNYTGDLSHIIVPNEADFEKAGKSTDGLQVGIHSDILSRLLLGNYHQEQTISFSKTNNQKVKAIGTDWSYVFSSNTAHLSKFDGSSLDVSNVTNMRSMFYGTSISDLASLANWNTSKVTDMSSMFANNSISNLTPLKNWDTSKVTDMSSMFASNSISDLTPLINWNVNNVTNMYWMFGENSIRDLTPLKNWDTSKVTDMSCMFAHNPDIIDLKPISNWNISDMSFFLGGLFYKDTKLNLTNINNTPLMQGFLKTPRALQNATFITNNADLVKATINKDPTLTNTAKRTITFNLPHATPETINQVIYYKAVPTVQVDSGSQEIVQTYPVKESDWQLDDSNSNVTVNGQLSTEYKAYTLYPKGKDVDFATIPLPKIPGYKAKISRIPSGNLAQPARFLVNFVALPSVNPGAQNTPDNTKQNQDVISDTKKLNTSNVQIVSNQSVLLENTDNNLQTLNVDTDTFTWQIENSVADELITPYVVFNSSHELHLPRFDNYKLQIINRTSNKNNLSFVYLNQNKAFKYVFNIKIADGKYLLSISEIENKRLIPVQEISFNDYHQLIKLIVKSINK